MGYLLREFRVVTLGFGPTLHLAQTRDAVRADGVKAAEHWRKNLSSYVGLLNNFHSGYLATETAAAATAPAASRYWAGAPYFAPAVTCFAGMSPSLVCGG